MESLTSWKLSRLGEISAWCRLLNIDGFLCLLGALLSVCAIPLVQRLQVYNEFVMLLSFCFVIFLLFALSYVLSADDIFSVMMGKEKCKVYVYKHVPKFSHKYYEIRILTKSLCYVFFAQEYNKDIFGKSKNAFIFYPLYDNKNKIWRLVNEDKDEPQILGQNVGKNIFLSTEKNEQKVTLNVLNNNRFDCLIVDKYVCSNIFVPSEWAQSIKRLPENEIIAPPQEYLITKENNQYRVFGIYNYLKAYDPEYFELIVPSLIFKDGIETVILAYIDSKYVEIYRGLSLGRISSTLITELDKKDDYKGLYGTVRRFDPPTLSFETLYEGPIFAIDFETGQIIGTDNQIFQP